MLLVLTGGALINEITPPVEPPHAFRFATRLLGGSAADYLLAASLHTGMPVRTRFSWQAAEPTQGAAYVWTSMDQAVDRAQAAGCPLLGVLAQAPAWATGGVGAGNFYPLDHQIDYYNFCQAVSARYAGQVTYYEVMNEPNIRNWTAAQYAEIVTGAGAALKTGDSTCKVISGVTAGPLNKPTTAGIPWATAVLNDAGCQAATDIWSHHLYVRPFAPEIGDIKGPVDTMIEASLAFMDSHGASGKELWTTEFGWPTTPTTLPGWVTEADQARFLVREAIIHVRYPRVKQIYQFQLIGSDTGTDEGGGMGLTRGTGDPNGADGTHKPSFDAWQTMCSILDENLIDTVDISTGTTWNIKFNRTGGRWGHAVWSVSGAPSVTITGLGSTARRTFIYGNQDIVNTPNGSYTFNTSGDPIYIEGVW